MHFQNLVLPVDCKPSFVFQKATIKTIFVNFIHNRLKAMKNICVILVIHYIAEFTSPYLHVSILHYSFNSYYSIVSF